MSGPDDAFDPFFYCTYHPDLKGLSAREARTHYQRHGRREARPPNPHVMLASLQEREGPLPPGFHPGDYLALNGDLRDEVRHPWQAAEHYLKHGRHHGRRHRPAPPSRLTERSSTGRLRRRLELAFGEAAVSDSLLLEVCRAVRQTAAATTPASPLMDPILLARWFMTPGAASGVTFDSFQDQLRVLFKVAFDPFAVLARSALEVEVISRIQTLAKTTQVFDGGPGRPGVTLLMLAAEAAHGAPFPEAPSPEQAAALVARFFVQDVRRLELEPFVTREQRALLRSPASQVDRRPLAAVMLEEVKGADPAGDDFLERGVWLNNLDFVLSSEQLQAAQIQVVAEGADLHLSAPSFLFEDHPDVMDEQSEAAQAWLQRFVWRERQDRGLPQTLVGASASAYASGAPMAKAWPQAPSVGGGGRKRLKPGEWLTFGAEGAGPQHLIGPGWHGAEPAHVWSAAGTALVAINLEAEPGPLDLFVRLSPGPRRLPQVSAWWNGCAVATLRPSWNRIFTLHGHLGDRHRTGPRPNILCLGVEGTFRVEGDSRNLGIALYDLMLAPR